MAAAAQAGGGVAALAGMEQLGALKQRAGSNTLVYSKFIAIGLFRLLELAGAMEPQALQTLAEAAGVPLAKVNADLNMYKGLLSKLQVAKDLMVELLQVRATPPPAFSPPRADILPAVRVLSSSVSAKRPLSGRPPRAPARLRGLHEDTCPLSDCTHYW